MLTGKDLLLLLLYAPGSSDSEPNAPIAGRTRLAKMIFVFEKEIWPRFRFDAMIPKDKLPQFYAWRFGPFSKDVFDNIDFFRSIRFISVTDREEPAAPEEAFELDHWTAVDNDEYESEEFTQETFRLTEDGIAFVKSEGLWTQLSEDQQSALIDLKGRFTKAPLYVILKYVYSKYPEMTEESEIADRFAH